MAETKAKPVKHYLGTGRRKTSVARVRLSEGTGQVRINDRGLDDFFTEIKTVYVDYTGKKRDTNVY